MVLVPIERAERRLCESAKFDTLQQPFRVGDNSTTILYDAMGIGQKRRPRSNAAAMAASTAANAMTAHEVISQLCQAMQESFERVRSILRRYDADKSGEIDIDEFRKIVAKIGVNVNDEGAAVDAAFRAIDKDGGGTISFGELDAVLRRREGSVTQPPTTPAAPVAPPVTANSSAYHRVAFRSPYDGRRLGPHFGPIHRSAELNESAAPGPQDYGGHVAGVIEKDGELAPGRYADSKLARACSRARPIIWTSDSSSA